MLIEDGENEINFCAGNLSSDAIKTFLRNHLCNACCQMIGLKENKDIINLVTLDTVSNPDCFDPTTLYSLLVGSSHVI